MALDNYDAGSSKTAYYPDGSDRPARLWATEHLLHTLAEMGAVEFFEGPGTDPTALTGYDSTKLWLQVSAGVTSSPGVVRGYVGTGTTSDIANWPPLTKSTLLLHLGADDGGDTSGFMRGPETGATGGAATNTFTAGTDQRFEIVKDGSPTNYTGTRASFILQHRDSATGVANGLYPAAIFQWNFTGDGDVTAASQISRTVWTGMQTSVVKSGDGSGHAYQVFGELRAVGAGGYNELGGFQGLMTNTGSTLGYMSGGEFYMTDSPDFGVTKYSTKMFGWVARIAKWHVNVRPTSCFVASSEGSENVDSAFSILKDNTQKFSYGVDMSYGTFSTGMVMLVKNNHSIAWVRALGDVAPVLLVNNTDDLYLSATTTTNTINFTNSAFGNILKLVPVASPTGSFQITASTSAAPIMEAIGSATDISPVFAAKGAGALQLGNNSSTSVILGHQAALATNATNGFAYIPTSAGNPTGTPTTVTGKVPMQFNTTDRSLNFYSGSEWLRADLGTWTSYTPTLTSGTGSLTTATPTGKYIQIGKTVIVMLQLSITNNGTGGGWINSTLPFSAANSGAATGRANAVSGKVIGSAITAGSAALAFQNYDSSYPASSGEVLTATIVYERS